MPITKEDFLFIKKHKGNLDIINAELNYHEEEKNLDKSQINKIKQCILSGNQGGLDRLKKIMMLKGLIK